MNTESRRACVAALARLARSADHRDRADAGRALAAFAELPEAAELLRVLLLDPDDTYVTRVTARALLRRTDPCGVAALCAALATADRSHQEWIDTAVHDTLGIFGRDLGETARICGELLGETSGADAVSVGARELLGILAGIDPVLTSGPCPA